MKKFLVLLLSVCLILSMMVGCTKKDQDTTGTDVSKPAVEDEETVELVKVGLGVVNSIQKSKDYSIEGTNETLAVGQVDTVMVAAAFDSDGKVVNVIIDNAQTKVNFDKDLKVTSDKSAENKTKVEKGDEYGMRNASGIKKEWYEQIAELENWMVGKTIDEIKAMKVKEVDAAHPSVPDVPELTSLVTITIQDYIQALEKAYANAVEVEGFDKLGLGHHISIGKSRDYSIDADGKETLPLAQVDTVMTATAFGQEGKVVATLIDNAQIKVDFDAEGKITTDKTAVLKTKKEKCNEYGMINASTIKKEWFEQVAELENWMVGKTVDEIKAMKVKEVDAAHPAVPDTPELTSLVTITVQDYIAVVEEAYNNAR